MNKKLMVFGIIGLFAMALVSAAIVSYFAMVETDVTVDAPITLEQSLFDISGETLNDGENHYLLIKGDNNFDAEVPTIPVITITKDDLPITNTTGLHLALDGGGDMHYCYDSDGDMTGVGSCNLYYVEWLENNPEYFDWIGNDADYDSSGFESPVEDTDDDSFHNIIAVGGTWANGVMTLPETGVNSGLIAALLVVKADFGVTPGDYQIKVEFKPVI